MFRIKQMIKCLIFFRNLQVLHLYLPGNGVFPESGVQIHCTESSNTTPEPFVFADSPSHEQRTRDNQNYQLKVESFKLSEIFDGLLFIIGESWGLWGLPIVQVRIEDVKAVEAHLRMGNSADSIAVAIELHLVRRSRWFGRLCRGAGAALISIAR